MRAVWSRVRRLEMLAPPKVVPVWDRFAVALDEAAHRLMGASYDSFKHDPAAQARIVEDVASGFCRRLSQADRELLIAELEQIPGVREEAAAAGYSL
jgi:hypothetical protein